jgi:hypothetical protein
MRCDAALNACALAPPSPPQVRLQQLHEEFDNRRDEFAFQVT